jgi:predicted transposase YdaD
LEKNSSLLPYYPTTLPPYYPITLLPILEGGGEETVVREAVNKLREDENLSDLEPLLSFFASFVLEMPLVQEIMRWDMVILRESPWYQEILKEGLQLGREEGETNLLIRLLSKRFGEIDESIASRIRQLDVSQREELEESIFDFSSLSDVYDWLESRS